MPRLRIGDLEADIPIVQGGMGIGISMSGLAAAVANEGGIGVVSSAGIGMLEDDYESNFEEANRRALRREIVRAKGLTRGIIGVNIMMALSDCDELIKTAVADGVDLVFVSAGLPLRVPELWTPAEWESITTKIVPVVSSARAARIIFQSWQKKYGHVPAAVVVEGPLAGGHLGFTRQQIHDPAHALEGILPGVISVMEPFERHFNKSIPVIAAGGIYTGADIHRFIQLGAAGVQMATRFVATDECDASAEFKDAYVECSKEDLTIIDSPVGLPGRAIRNRFLEEIESGNKMPFKCPWKCLRTCDVGSAPYCIARALTNANSGHLEQGFAFAGANAYKIDRVIPVGELLKTLVMEYEMAESTSGARQEPESQWR